MGRKVAWIYLFTRCRIKGVIESHSSVPLLVFLFGDTKVPEPVPSENAIPR